MIEINGEIGGGQVLRTALAFSILSGKAFSINAIRSGRPNPGLRPQHCAAIRLASELCDGVATGADEGSMNVTFYPRTQKDRTISLDIGTAGSLTLLAQTVVPAAIFGPGKVRLRLTGGSDVPWSPPADYMRSVLSTNLRPYGVVDVRIKRRGFYPVGGGKIEVIIRPNHLREDEPFDTYLTRISPSLPHFKLQNRSPLSAIRGVSFASSELEKSDVAARAAREVRRYLSDLGVPVNIDVLYGNSDSPGAVVTVWGRYGEVDGEQAVLGGSALGDRGVRAEMVGALAAKSFLKSHQLGACVDEYMADQIMPILALTRGSVRVPKYSDHMHSVAHVTEMFFGKRFEFSEDMMLVR